MLSVTNKVESTVDYEKFGTAIAQPNNRVSKQFKKLCESIYNYGYNASPALVGTDGRLIDGHTRLKACIVSNKPFRYLVVSNIAGLIAEVNNTSSAWTPLNYIESYAQQNPRGEYAEFLTFYNSNAYTLSLLQAFTIALRKQGILSGSLCINYTELSTKLSIYERVVATLGIYCTTHTQLANALQSIVFKDGVCGETFLVKLRLGNPQGRISSVKDIRTYFQDVLKREVA